MNYAIITLEHALDTLENNEPIHRREGNIAQADLELANANQIRQALIVLRAVEQAHPTPVINLGAGAESGGGTIDPPDEPPPDNDPK